MDKDHQRVSYQQELYLDECSLHRVLSSDQSIQQIYKITTEALNPKFKYHLNAIVSHIGEPSTGQYSAYIRYRYKHMQYWVLHCANKKVLVSEK